MTKWLAVDPGESTGWSLWDDDQLLDAGTEELWAFGDSIFGAVFRDTLELELADDELALKLQGIEHIVCEDFRIYPWEARKGSLNWDQVRTARLIGAMTIICRNAGMKFTLQGAKIKERSEAAGAESFFMYPLHENRHANDSIRHGVYYLAVEQGAHAVPMEGDGSSE